MFPRYEVDIDFIKKNWKDPEKSVKDITERILNPLSDFKQIQVFGPHVEFFSCCFKGHHQNTHTGNLKMVKYGYALTVESIEKFLLENYADDENEYLVEADLMSMDYEKYYKNGRFVDLEGNYTGRDFYQLDDCDELEKKAQFENNWIHFCIYDINRNSHGEIIEDKETEEVV